MLDNTKPKQVLVLRKDLGMKPGKCVAQGSHASLGAVIKNSSFEEFDDHVVKTTVISKESYHWFKQEFTKVCCKCDSEEELLALHKKAQEAGIPCSLIRDAGHTVFHGVPTYTALGIGPASAEQIDAITGHLKLF